MNILFAAAEMAPFCKTGELADVIGDLPPAVAERGHSVAVVIPGYAVIDRARHGFIEQGIWIQVPVGCDLKMLSVSSLEWRGVTVYLIENDEYFVRPGIYGDPGGEYGDNGVRFMFFSRAVIEILKIVGFRPDVIHAHDWPTALVVAYIKSLYAKDPFFSGTATLFTIHRLQYQGIFHESVFWLSGLPGDLFHRASMEHYGNVSFLKGGVALADAVSTVSERYARDIATRENGFGLHELFASRANDLYGITNGIDLSASDPSTNPLIPARFDVDDLAGKKECRLALLHACGLTPDDNVPVFGMVSRLSDNKGVHQIDAASSVLDEFDIQGIFLGTDTPEHQSLMIKFASSYPRRIRVMLRFDKKMAHMIYAGADAYLMPSKFEPCGLAQFIAMRYGALPVVHATGGLADSIIDLDSDPENGNGFSFREYTTAAFKDAVSRTVRAFLEPGRERWNAAVRRAMSGDYSWNRSAERYIDLYHRIHEKSAASLNQ